MSSTSVVVAVRPCHQHPPRGGHHRCLQLWWWPLSDLAASTPQGPAINVLTSVVAAVESTASTPRGSVIIVFNFGGGRCRTLLLAPPRGLAIDVFNFRGGRCRICRQHPLGGLPSTSSTSVVAVAGPCR
jgi:hypothetical protein